MISARAPSAESQRIIVKREPTLRHSHPGEKASFKTSQGCLHLAPEETKLSPELADPLVELGVEPRPIPIVDFPQL